MNTIFQLVLLTLSLLQLGATAFIPINKLMSRSVTNRQIASARQVFNNDIDEYEPQKTDEDLNSHTCVYYDSLEECHKTNDGCGVKIETCNYRSSNRGCYALWNGETKVLQGCWLPSSRDDCTPGACVSEHGQYVTENYRGTYFCCCFGDNCNENYGLSNQIPSSNLR